MSTHNKCKLKLIEPSFSTCFGAHCVCFASHIGVRWIGRKNKWWWTQRKSAKECEKNVIIIQLLYPPKLDSTFFFRGNTKTSKVKSKGNKKPPISILIVWTSLSLNNKACRFTDAFRQKKKNKNFPLTKKMELHWDVQNIARETAKKKFQTQYAGTKKFENDFFFVFLCGGIPPIMKFGNQIICEIYIN